LQNEGFALNDRTNVIVDSKFSDIASLLTQTLNKSFGFHLVIAGTSVLRFLLIRIILKKKVVNF